MKIEAIKTQYEKHKEVSLHHRYITNKHIEPLLEKYAKFFEVEPEALLNYEIEKFTHEQLKEIAFNNPLNDDTQPATN